ncbi:MAG: SNF2-related protein [Chloroflexota bacterium]
MQHVLHVHWQPAPNPDSPAGMLFWCETAVYSQPDKLDRRSKQARPHPYLTSPNSVKELLNTLTTLSTSRGKPRTAVFSLPTGSFGPLTSPQLFNPFQENANGKTIWRPWQIKGVWFTLEQSYNLLMRLPDELTQGVRFGSSCRYWQTAVSLVLETIAQQKVQPSLVRHGDSYESRWRPVLDGEQDGPRLARLAAAMPAICRAETATPEEAIAPRHLLQAFLHSLTDALVRWWTAGEQPTYTLGNRDASARWVQAHFAVSPAIKASGTQLNHLYRGYQAWLRSLTLAGDDTFRIAFRLEAPIQKEEGKPDDAWQLHFLLQAREDPSLLVPAAAVWQAQGGILNLLDKQFVEPQEKLLAGLGYAARFFEPLRRGLQTAKPIGVALDTHEAYQFLREAAPLLEQSGFGLLVPPWWNKPGTRLGVRLKLESKNTGEAAETAVSKSLLSLENLVNYSWELSLGDTTLTRAEFDALVALKSPLVQIRGQWVQLSAEQIEAAIRFWEKQRLEATISLQEAVQMGLTQQDEVDGLPVDGVELEGWINDWMKQLNRDAALEPLSPPENLHATLRPYQLYGYSWLDFMHRWGMGAILADDMGLGKCIRGDSLVTVNGRLQAIEDLWHNHQQHVDFDGEGHWTKPNQELLINALDEESGQITTAPVKRLYRQYVKEPLRQIELEDGNFITITKQHKLLSEKGWTTNLEAGGYLCVPKTSLWSEQPADPELVELMAWQIAEGYEIFKSARVHITQKDTEQLEHLLELFKRIAERYKLKINTPRIYFYKDKTPSLNVTSVAYRNFLTAKGYSWGKLSSDKSLPPFILKASRNNIRIFLRNFFEAEGSVIESMRSIEISSASALLMQQLSLLLRRFGIWLRLAQKLKRATNGSGIYRTYYLGTLGGNALRLFEREIGFLSERKKQKLALICSTKNNTNVEGIPASQIVADLVESTKLPLRHLGMYNTVYVDGSQQFSQTSLNKVIHSIDQILSGEAEQAYRELKPSKWTQKTLSAYKQLDKETLSASQNLLTKLLNQEVFYCRIKAVKEINFEGWVYDLEVAKHHNFVANHILCHNTIQTLALVERDKELAGALPGPILLVCPTSVVTNWGKEAEKFTPNVTTLVHQGPDRLRGEALIAQAKQTDMVLTSYALVRRDAETLEAIDWYGVVLDEAQNIKNPNTKQARAIRSLAAGFKLALTGTPVENRLSELWSIMQFLNPGFLGSQKGFRKKFVLPIERYGDETAVSQLRQLTSPFILRRVKTDPSVIQDLPDKQETKVYCHLTEEQATLYEAVVQETMQKVAASSGIQRRGLVLSMLMKLKQICNHPAQFLHQVGDGSVEATADILSQNRSGKLQRLTQLLEEALTNNERALIFTQFAAMGHLLESYLQNEVGIATQFLHGGVPAKRRRKMIDRFQEDENGPPIFLLSLKAGGTGLNLTRANHVFHFDRWWNPAVENQATDRAFRIGQQKNVLVHKFVCVGTLEERIDEMIEGKKALAESVVGSGENWLTELSTGDLRSLVKLRREVVV